MSSPQAQPAWVEPTPVEEPPASLEAITSMWGLFMTSSKRTLKLNSTNLWDLFPMKLNGSEKHTSAPPGYVRIGI